jgi:hypothetical protein
MRAVVVFESMYGNTRAIAEAIGEGLRPALDTTVVPVGRAGPEVLDGAQFLVVGGPTHVHGMTRPRSRAAAAEMARDPHNHVVLEDGADGPGVREWLASLEHLNVFAAVFDTRMHGPAAFTGRASKGITRELVQLGAHVVVEPESFLVKKDNVLDPGEDARARRWGERLRDQILLWGEEAAPGASARS